MRIELRRASAAELRAKPAQMFRYLCISGPPNAKSTKSRKRAATLSPCREGTASLYLTAPMSRLMRAVAGSSASSKSAAGAGSND
jgi:hypothetical protein